MVVNQTKDLTKETAPFVAVSLLWVCSVAAVVTLLCLAIYWFVAPVRVAIDNRVFHSSQPYNDGMARDLDNLRLAYATSDQEGKDTIRATIRHRFAGYDASQLPPDLQSFLSTVRK